MKKAMWSTAFLTGAGCAVFAYLGYTGLAITLGTCFYHLAMRLAVGYVMLLVPRRFNADSGWFAERAWEKKLYNRLRLKAWKGNIPTFNPEDFDMKLHTPAQIVQTMCVSELVHEIIVVLSFVPLLFALAVGALPVFLLTSLAAAGYDCIFVMLQRYNRPRMMALARRAERRG